jgi:hypothetical protein
VITGEPELQRLVIGGQLAVSAQRIADREPLAPQVAAGLGEMEVDNQLASPGWLDEVMCDVWPVWRVLVRELT